MPPKTVVSVNRYADIRHLMTCRKKGCLRCAASGAK